MNTKFTVLVLALGFSLAPVTARADDQATAASQLLVAQMLDGITTRALLQKPGTFERDPLARSAAKTDLGTVGAVVVLNVLDRVLFRHAVTVTRVLTGFEAICIGNNVRILTK
jgi:hypothetical protein